MTSMTGMAASKPSRTETIALLEGAVAQAGFIADELECNSELEIYCKVHVGRFELSVAKGWSDPGFRVFAWIEIPQALKHSLTLGALAKHCAVNGLALTAVEGDDPALWQVETVVYTSGFNAECLKELFGAFENCLTGVHALSRSLLLARNLRVVDT
jgi:hypothetical protein